MLTVLSNSQSLQHFQLPNCQKHSKTYNSILKPKNCKEASEFQTNLQTNQTTYNSQKYNTIIIQVQERGKKSQSQKYNTIIIQVQGIEKSPEKALAIISSLPVSGLQGAPSAQISHSSPFSRKVPKVRFSSNPFLHLIRQ